MATDQIRSFLEKFILTNEQMSKVITLFDQDISKGIGKATNAEADMKCWLTYVQDLPTGNEEGKFLALDLGGTHLRVLCVILKGQREATLVFDVYQIPTDIFVGTGAKLFDYIADCLAKFIEKEKIDNDHLPLGFAFSFPCLQVSLSEAKLAFWGKGFDLPDVVDQDVGRLLTEAIARRGNTQIKVMVILNDTTGTLISCAHRNPTCRIGAIVGTGFNICYTERVENIELLPEEHKKKKYMILNCESGGFGDSGTLEFIRTDYDRVIDDKSLHKGQQMFEKMISGMYLGELMRLVLLDAVQHNLLFESDKDNLIELLLKESCIDARHISEIEGDGPHDSTSSLKFAKEILHVENASNDDIAKLKFACEVISRRSASLVALGLSSLVNRINEPEIIIGVDGSVYKNHPKYATYIKETMKTFVDPNIQFLTMISEDGSGRGAALAAAAASSCECNCTCE